MVRRKTAGQDFAQFSQGSCYILREDLFLPGYFEMFCTRNIGSLRIPNAEANRSSSEAEICLMSLSAVFCHMNFT
jgi:hypothetical protein